MWKLHLSSAARLLGCVEEITCSFPAMVPATMRTCFGNSKRKRDRAGSILPFSVSDFRGGDNCFFFAAEDDPQVNLETKLDKMIRLVRLLDFLSTHIDSFGEGVIFSAATLAARCNGDSRAEHFLQETAKGATYAERLESLLQSLVRQGYLSDYDPSRQEYRVLSAINYLFDFADRIRIREDETEARSEDA